MVHRTVGRVATVAGRILDVAVGGILVAIVCIALAQVAARDVFNASLTWSGELNRLLYIWLILLAAIRAPHMHITLLVDAVPRPAALGLRIVSAALALSMLALLFVHGQTVLTLQASDRFIGIPITKDWLYWPLLGVAGLWGLTVIGEVIDTWFGRASRDNGETVS